MAWQDREIRCDDCHGLHPDGVLVCPPPCDYCYGTGEQTTYAGMGMYRAKWEIEDCGACDGTGIDKEWILMEVGL